MLRGAGAAAARLSSALVLGAGHNNAHLVGLGQRSSVTASAAEPTVLLLSGAGLVVAAVLRRSRRS